MIGVMIAMVVISGKRVSIVVEVDEEGPTILPLTQKLIPKASYCVLVDKERMGVRTEGHKVGSGNWWKLWVRIYRAGISFEKHRRVYGRECVIFCVEE